MPDQKPPDSQPIRDESGAAREDTTASPGKAPAAAKPEVSDDVVTTRHTLKVGRASLEYTATTGRMVPREEVFEEGKFTGYQAKAEVSMTPYVVDGPPNRPVTF